MIQVEGLGMNFQLLKLMQEHPYNMRILMYVAHVCVHSSFKLLSDY